MLRPRRRGALRGARSGPTRAWTSRPTSSTGSGLEELEDDRGGAAARSPGRPASATTPRPTAPPSTPTRPRSRPRRRRSSPAARRTSTARSRPRRAWFTRRPEGRLRGPARRAAPREGRPRGLLLPAHHRRLPARASTSSTPTTFRAGRTGRRPRTTYHEAVPGHHFQLALEMELEGLPAFRHARLPGRRARPTSRAGRSTRSGSPTRPASSGARPSASACSTARRCGPSASSSTPGSTPSAGAARRRSRRWSTAGIHPTDAGIETDRYIAWPGQALAYMTGRREIERLRARAGRPGGRRRSTSGASTTTSCATASSRSASSATSCSAELTPRPPRGRPAPEDPMTAEPRPDAAAVNDLADRFWERLLEENAAHGDPLRRRALRRPAPRHLGRPGGRRRERCARRRSPSWRRSPSDGLPIEERITHDMLRVVCELGDPSGRPADGRDRERRPDGRAPDAPLAGRAGPARRHARAAGEAAGPVRGLPGPTSTPPSTSLDEGRADGSTAARLVAERVIAQTERLLAIPAAESALVRIPRLAEGAEAAGRAALEAAVERDVRPALARYLEAIRGPYLAATRADPGLWSAPRGEARYRMAMRRGRRSTSTPPRSTRSASPSWRRSATSSGPSPARAGFGDDVDAYRAALHADPANAFATKADLVARATRGHRAGARSRRRGSSGACPGPAARSAPSRSSWRRTPRSPTTTRRPSTARGPASTS